MTDCDWLEQKFRAHPNEWLRMTDLIAWSQQERGHGLTVHSRVPDLRAQGMTIEQQGVREWNGFHQRYSDRVTSYYRFVPLEAAAVSATVPAAASSGNETERMATPDAFSGAAGDEGERALGSLRTPSGLSSRSVSSPLGAADPPSQRHSTSASSETFPGSAAPSGADRLSSNEDSLPSAPLAEAAPPESAGVEPNGLDTLGRPSHRLDAEASTPAESQATLFDSPAVIREARKFVEGHLWEYQQREAEQRRHG